MAEIFGYIERITFQNNENGYTVAQLKDSKRHDLVSLVGCMPGLKPGESVRCQGEWKQHLVHGSQFTLTSFKVEAPADVLGIKKYLGSGLIKGIGPKYAGRIVEKFEADTLNIIDKQPERLHEIEGLGKKRIEKIIDCWVEQKSIREVMIFLQSHGVSPSYAQKVFKAYGDQSIKKVTSNPFQLARDIFGIGFKTADEIAQKLGIAKDAPARLDAGLEYTLSECSDEGHVCFPLQELIKIAEERLAVPSSLLENRLESLMEERRIEIGDMVHHGKLEKFAWLKPLFLAEVGICRQAARLRFGTCHLREVDMTKALEWVQKKHAIELASNQQVAISHALKDKLLIIPGPTLGN